MIQSIAYKDALVGPANTILMATFGLSLIIGMKKGEDFLPIFEKLVIAFICLRFYSDGLDLIYKIGNELGEHIDKLGNKNESLRQFILGSFKETYKNTNKYESTNPTGSLSMFGQALRLGVWGTVSSIAEFIFLIAGFIIRVARDSIWQIIYLLFPIGISFIPIFPKIFQSLVTFAIEVTLWLPLLKIIDIATTAVAREYARKDSDIGFLTIAAELTAIILTFSIHPITHQIVSGSMSGGFMHSWTKPTSLVRSGAKSLGGVAGKFIAIAFILNFIFSNETAHAKEIDPLPLTLYQGYVTKIECEGRLLISSIGDEKLIKLEALPQEVGCAVLVKPRSVGITNLLLETSAGTVKRILSVKPKNSVSSNKLHYKLGVDKE